MANEGDKKVTIMDAKQLLMKVKETFQEQREKLEEFVEVVKDFKAHRIGVLGVMMKVEKIFKGHEDLILEFNNFLPKGYEVLHPLEDEQPSQKTLVVHDAMNYLDMLKARLQNHDVYNSFLNIVTRFKRGEKTTRDVEQEVAALLLKDYPDLVREFTKFLPYHN